MSHSEEESIQHYMVICNEQQIMDVERNCEMAKQARGTLDCEQDFCKGRERDGASVSGWMVREQLLKDLSVVTV